MNERRGGDVYSNSNSEPELVRALQLPAQISCEE